MFWNRLRERRGGSIAKLYCRTHELWLNRALASNTPAPRIPIKRVDDGGYSGLSASLAGRAHAQRWWDRALGRVQLLDEEAAP
jgi:hypothetical protein